MPLAGIVEWGGLFIIAVTAMQAVCAVYGFVLRGSAQRRHASAELGAYKKYAAILLQRATAERERSALSWSGKRKFRIDKRVMENRANDVCSFYLVPHDNRPVPPYLPGQFLTFELPIPDQPGPVIRCYSLSDSPQSDCYRVTVKKLPPPPDASPGSPAGLASSFFHERLREGDIVEVMAPSGEFYLNEDSDRPVVLIAGGIGLTPLLSMVNALAAQGGKREIWLFYGVRNRADHVMFDHLKRIDREHANIHLVVCYSQPTLACRKGEDYTYEGFVSVELFRSLLGTSNYEYYLCGPPPMMEMVTRELKEWGVPDEDVRYEAFGPATIKKTQDYGTATAGASACEIVFARSNQILQWTPAAGTLLEFGQANGIKISCGCRSGSCGTCLTALKEGVIKYVHKPGRKPEAGSCLVCIAEPDGRVVLDA